MINGGSSQATPALDSVEGYGQDRTEPGFFRLMSPMRRI